MHNEVLGAARQRLRFLDIPQRGNRDTIGRPQQGHPATQGELAGFVGAASNRSSKAVAIVAREFGMPAVVGCGDATSRLRTGDRVRVDGTRGTVEPLQTPTDSERTPG